MADGVRRLVFPQDKTPAANRSGEELNDATPPPPAEREGARRLSIPDQPEPRREGARRLVIPDSPAPEGARRIQIPENTMSDDRPTRRLNIPDSPAVPAAEPTRARRLSVPETTPAPVPADAPRARRLAIPDTPASAPTAPPAPSTRPRAISVPDTPTPAPTGRMERPKTRTDALIEKAQLIEPTIQMSRLRGRIDTILAMSMSDILNWGQRNLAPLQDASNRKAQIASEMSRINAVAWMTEAKNAACKIPSFMDRFTAKPPAFYESMLQKVRAELMQFVSELDKMKAEFFREVGDLHCDALAMLVCVEEFPDPNAQRSADNRARTLLMSHQTAAMLQATIENSLNLSAQQIQQIDSLLSVTIPNWKMAYGAK